ncbi:hypothetical protein KKB18_13360 [bacterium]|nr:hypothetical protein [bacterium]
MGVMEWIGIWIAATLTLFIYSFLYKDNPFYRFAESLYVGISFGYYIGLSWNWTIKKNLITPLFSDFSTHWYLIIPGTLGLMLYTRYIPKIAWMSQISLAVYIGYFMGVQFIQKLHGEVLPQMSSTILPINSFSLQSLWNLIIVVGVFSVVIYFYFSSEHKGPFKGISKLGIWFVMISFGAAFGYTVMARISLLMGRLMFLWYDWAIKAFWNLLTANL